MNHFQQDRVHDESRERGRMASPNLTPENAHTVHDEDPWHDSVRIMDKQGNVA